MEIGSKIMYGRKMKGWSQTDLGKLVGMTKASISGIEKGHNKPSPKNLKKISDALGIPMEMLVENFDPALKSQIVEQAKKIPPEKIREKLQGLGLSDEKIEAAILLLL